MRMTHASSYSSGDPLRDSVREREEEKAAGWVRIDLGRGREEADVEHWGRCVEERQKGQEERWM
jgi:hypothetical protein